MTTRQLFLHDEMIRISDIFQLGLSVEDRDWFWKFIQRCSEKRLWHTGDLLSLDFLSIGFLNEFKLLSEYIVIHPKRMIEEMGFAEVLKNIPSRYGVSALLGVLSQIKDELKDEWVEEGIDVFDDSIKYNSKLTYCNRATYSAWHFVMNSKSISDLLKNKYKDKDTRTEYFHENGEHYPPNRFSIKETKTIWEKIFS